MSGRSVTPIIGDIIIVAKLKEYDNDGEMVEGRLVRTGKGYVGIFQSF